MNREQNEQRGPCWWNCKTVTAITVPTAVFLGLIIFGPQFILRTVDPSKPVPYTLWDWAGSPALLTIITGGLASATYGLFKRTADLVGETKEAVNAAQAQFLQAERHHLNDRMGLLAVTSSKFLSGSRQYLEKLEQNFIVPALECVIENGGVGPAVNVIVTFTLTNGDTIRQTLGTIKAGAEKSFGEVVGVTFFKENKPQSGWEKQFDGLHLELSWGTSGVYALGTTTYVVNNGRLQFLEQKEPALTPNVASVRIVP